MNTKPTRNSVLLRLFLLAGTAALLLLLLAATVWYDNALHRGVAYGGSELHTQEPFPYSDGVQVGVNTFNVHLEPDPQAVTRTLELVRDMGATHVRMQVPWDDIEIHGRGDFEDRRNLETVGTVSAWAKYDRIVAAAEDFDIELVMRLDRTPEWARPQAIAAPEFQEGLQIDGNSTGPPDDFADYGNFVRAVVERYRGRVRFFQIWNEPNLRNEWNWQEPRPAEFVALLRIGYTAVKSANPDAVVLFPSLSPTDGLDRRAPMTELDYLDAVYRAGGGAYFDIMSGQAYGLGQPPDERRYVFLRRDNWRWERAIDTRNDVGRIVLLREVMEAHGDAGKPIWVGEFGWNSAPESIPPERRFVWGEPVSEEVKGAYIVGQIERARRDWPWMGVMQLWMLRYGGYREPDPADPTPYFGIVSRDWRQLPAYAMLQDYLQEPATTGAGVYTWQHPAVETVGDRRWRLRFVGTRLLLLGELGEVDATLNGTAIALAQTRAGAHPALATPYLSEGEHILELRTGTAAPDRFIVEREPAFLWLWSVLPAALIGLLAAVIAAALWQIAQGPGVRSRKV